MEDPVLVALLLFVVTLAGSRILTERAMRTLPDVEKLRILEAFSGSRMYSALVLVALLVGVVAAPDLFPAPVYLALLVAYVIGTLAMNFRKLRALAAPASYVRAYFLGQGLQLAGVAVYFAALLGWMR